MTCCRAPTGSSIMLSTIALYLIVLLSMYTTERFIYSSCKEIRDSNSLSPSGEYSIRTTTGRILEKVPGSLSYSTMLVFITCEF